MQDGGQQVTKFSNFNIPSQRVHAYIMGWNKPITSRPADRLWSTNCLCIEWSTFKDTALMGWSSLKLHLNLKTAFLAQQTNFAHIKYLHIIERKKGSLSLCSCVNKLLFPYCSTLFCQSVQRQPSCLILHVA